MVQKLVSVIIPAYNVAPYILEAIESVINQTYSNIEIIIINDGSTDGTLEAVSELPVSNRIIKIITQRNQGVSVARNTGIQSASGEYLMFLDGDDWLESNCVSTLMSYMTNDVEIVKCAFKLIDRENKIERYRNVPTISCSGSKAIQDFLTGKGWASSVCGGVYRSDFVKKHLKFKTGINIGEDGIFTMDALCLASNIVSVNVSLYNIRFRRNSASRKEISYSQEHLNIPESVDMLCSRKSIDAFKLRVMLSNLLRTSLGCRFDEFSKLYILHSNQGLSGVNISGVRNLLPMRMILLGILAKNKYLFFITIHYFLKLLLKPLY